MLLASNGGMEWEQVGSSSSFLDSFGNVRHANGRFETPAARNATVCFSFSKYFFWVRCLLVTAKIVAALFWIAAGFAVAARENTGRVIVGSAQMLSAVTMACVAVSGVTQVGFAEASDLIVAASCILCFAYCFLVDEAALLRCTTVASCIGLANTFVHLICFNDVVLFGFAAAMNAGTIAFFMIVSHRRRRHLQESLALVQDDAVAYDAVWAALAETCSDSVSKLKRLTDGAWQSKVTEVYQYQPEQVCSFCSSPVAKVPAPPRIPSAGVQSVKPASGTGQASDSDNLSLFLGADIFTMGRHGAVIENDAVTSTIVDATYEASAMVWSKVKLDKPQPATWSLLSYQGRRKVSSLDELYETAAAAEPVLRSKAQEWASRSRGCFFRRREVATGGGHGPEPACFTPSSSSSSSTLSSSSTISSSSPSSSPSPSLRLGDAKDAWSSQLVRWEEGGRWGGGECEVRWARLKSPQRAVEKVYRAYGGEVARLADICRQSIVFAGLEDLAACLAAILADPDVAVERIKNRYSPTYHASASAGYRDVALNLRFLRGRAHASLVAHHLRPRVAAHVCELQLILAPFAARKSAQGHAHYVRFRDLRGQ